MEASVARRFDRSATFVGARRQNSGIAGVVIETYNCR